MHNTRLSLHVEATFFFEMGRKFYFRFLHVPQHILVHLL
jgi:hypothetical protein